MTIASNHTKTAIQKGVYSMKLFLEVCVAGSILICVAGAQESPKAAPRKGISVQMPVANHAVEMRAADEPNATVVAITADGKVFAGIEPTEPAALNNLSAETVYVKSRLSSPVPNGTSQSWTLYVGSRWYCLQHLPQGPRVYRRMG
jgi:hypothetical protein